MSDRMKHRFVDDLREWLHLLTETRILSEMEMTEVLRRASPKPSTASRDRDADGSEPEPRA